jgi:class 3 adenylate cyclase
MNILKRIIDIGTRYKADPVFNKHIRFTNSVALIVCVFAVENAVLGIAYGEFVMAGIVIIHGLLISLMFYFNALGKRVLAATWFSTVALSFVTFYGIVYTLEGLNYFFLPLIIFLQFFLFSVAEKHLIILFTLLTAVAFAGVIAFHSAGLNPPLAISADFIEMQRWNSYMGIPGLSIAFGVYAFMTINNAEREASREKEKTEQLLLNILPAAIAQRFKDDRSFLAEGYDSVTVLFADIVGFSTFSESTSPGDLVSFLNEIFSKFDALTEKYGVEKIKTIGDAYMVAGGVPVPVKDHTQKICEMALEMLESIRGTLTPAGKPLAIRIGISSGPVSAGVIGVKKFIYDLWGDTVNVASRMQSHSTEGYIQITEDVYNVIKHDFECTPRGTIQVKSKGEMSTYFLISRKER